MFADVQTGLLDWAARQSLSTGAVLAVFGLLCAFQGFRLARLLVAAQCGLAGLVLGRVLASWLGLDWFAGGSWVALGSAGLLAALPLVRYRPGLMVACMTLCGGLGVWAAGLLGAHGQLAGLLVVTGTGVGMAVAAACLRRLPLMLTTAYGAILLVLSFVTLATNLVPSLGATFREFAADHTLLVPLLLGMLFVTGYAYQVNLEQGDVETGGGRSWNSVRV